MARGPFISVIIPVFNGADTIASCLQSVFQSDCSDFEVIVVDDGSTDDTMKHVIDFNCRIVALETNHGPAEARNHGARKAKGDILFFLDADITIESNTLTEIILTFHERKNLGGLFCSYQKNTPVQNFISKYKNILHHYTHQISREEAVTFCSGFGAIKRDVFLSLGGFDPNVRFLEDIELGYRLHRAGHSILLKKNVQLTHHKHYSFRDLIRSDVMGRAKPWTKLMMEYGIFRNDLNTRFENIFSIPVAYLVLVSLVISFARSYGFIFLLLIILVFVILNSRFLVFVMLEKNGWFMLKSLGVLWFGYLYSGVGVILGLCSFLFDGDGKD